jgi:hypothetical protein
MPFDSLYYCDLGRIARDDGQCPDRLACNRNQKHIHSFVCWLMMRWLERKT